MHKKILSLALAATFMLAAFGGALFMGEQSEATTTTGAYSVYAYDGTEWSAGETIQNVYDAAQAVVGSGLWQTGDSMVPKYVEGTYVTYNDATYGNLSTFMGMVNGTDGTWKYYVSNTSGILTQMTASLGNYTCFGDHEYQAANVVLYLGDSTTTLSEVQSSFSDYIQESSISLRNIIPVVSGDTGFQFTFAMHINYTEDVELTINGSYTDNNNVQVTQANLQSNDIILTGYGSNALHAFQQVINNANDTNISTTAGTYSWITSIFNQGTMLTDDNGTETWVDDVYAYWMILDEYTGLGDNANNVSDFVLGAFAPFSFAPIYDKTIALVFDEYSMSN